ncbi:MAG: two-component sensor histidine kinase [Hyphomonadaceae bacterium]|nr:two-component sensor histidine kinase [Hyphomonadaceae bacterium]
MSIDAPDPSKAPATQRGGGFAFRWLRPASRPPAMLEARVSGPMGAAGRLRDLAPVFEAIPGPAILIDASARVAAANASARRRWGLAYDAGGAVTLAAAAKGEAPSPGLPLARFLRQFAPLEAAQAVLRDGQTRAVDYCDPAPVEEHFRCTISRLQWAGAEGALLVFSDVTAQINSERMRVEFVANASHELRTPLTAFTAALETILGPAKDSEADRNRFLTMMSAHADRMKRLIDDLLSLSRIELDEHVPPEGQADLVAVLNEAVDWAAPIAAKRGVRFEIKAPRGRALVVGDRIQIGQVAQNLIDNAEKYSPDNGVVEIEVGLAEDREEAVRRSGRQWPEASRISMVTPLPASDLGYAYFRVVDHGPGIKRRYLPKLGERFFRVAREEGEPRRGTGLGLAIVKHIVNRHRGGMVVESQVDAGSAFGVYLERPAEA